MKKPTATAIHRNRKVTPMASDASGEASERGIHSLNIGPRLARIQSSTPNAVRYACFAESLRKLTAVSRESVLAAGIAWRGSTKLLMPRESASSSRFPNSDMTMPMASLSDLPSDISSLYLSSII